MKLFLLTFLVALPAWGAKEKCRDAVVVPPLRPEQIYFQLFGDPKAPPLVLIHGLGGSTHSFKTLAPRLAQNYFVIVYDQRGHGRTAQQGWDYSLPVMASDLNVLLDHLKIPSAHLLGASFGARTAMQFAYEHPERVRSLLVEDMEMIPRVVDYVDEYLEKARLSEHLPLYFKNREDAYPLLRPFFSHWEALDALYSMEETEKGWELYFRPHGTFLYDLGGNGADLSEQLKSFQAPLLFVRAEPSRSFLFEEGVAHIKRHRPDVPILTVWGAEHVIHASHLRQFLQIANEFFQAAL